jgi:solute carrier family 25 oxoglutarate transporter 11
MSGKQEYKSSFDALQKIIRSEGVATVYTGLSAGLARQATYTTTRLGIYTWLLETFSEWVILLDF